MAILNQRLHKKNASGEYDTVYLETKASMVLMEDGTTVEHKLQNVGGMNAATYTLSSSGWSLGSDGRYAQTLSIDGVTADASQVIVVDVALSGSDLDADAEVCNAWEEPSGHNVMQAAGKLTFYAYTAPSINIPIYVGV